MRVLISAVILAESSEAEEATSRAKEGWLAANITELKALGDCGAHVVVTVPESRAKEWDKMVRQLDLAECEFRP